MSRLSNSTSLKISSITGSIKHPVPFPPIKDKENTSFKLKVCGSTNILLTLPEITGSTNAVFASPDDISIFGGFITS